MGWKLTLMGSMSWLATNGCWRNMASIAQMLYSRRKELW